MTNGYAQAGGNLLVGLLSGFMEGRAEEKEREVDRAEKEKAFRRRLTETMIRTGQLEPTTEEAVVPIMGLPEMTLGDSEWGRMLGVEPQRVTKGFPPTEVPLDKGEFWKEYGLKRAALPTAEEMKAKGYEPRYDKFGKVSGWTKIRPPTAPRAPRVTPEEKRKADYRKWMADLATKRVGKERVGGLSEKVIASLEIIQTLPAKQAWRKFYENEAEFTTAEADIIKSGLIRLFGGMGRTKAGIVPPAEEDLPTLMERIISGLVPGQYKRR